MMFICPLPQHANTRALTYQTYLHSLAGGGRFQMLFIFLIFTTALSHCDSSHGKFGLLFPGKASCNSHATKPMVQCSCVLFVDSAVNPVFTKVEHMLSTCVALLSILILLVSTPSRAVVSSPVLMVRSGFP